MYHVIPMDPAVAEAYDRLSPLGKEFYQERAAILEFESGLPRKEAEAEALTQTHEWLRDRATGF